MAGVSRTVFRVKTSNGRRFKVGGESEVSSAAALAYAQAKLKLVSGVILSGSQSTGLDTTITANQPGHTDAADGLNLEIKDGAGATREIHIPQASNSYAGSVPGYADITNADLLAVVTAYNTATGLSFTLIQAKYTSEG